MAPLALKNRFRLLAFGLTIGFHLAALSPFAHWLDRHLLPVLQEDGLEIELIQPETEQLPPLPKKQKKEEPLPKDDEPDYVFRNLPQHKKKLSEKIDRDQVINPQEDKPPRPEELETDSKSTDWDLIDQIVKGPLTPQQKQPIPGQKPSVKLQEKSSADNVSEPNQTKAKQKQRRQTPPEKNAEAETNTLQGEQLKQRSPLFLKPGETVQTDGTPAEIRETFRSDQPEKTNWDKLEFSLNTYQWSYQRYIENWAIDINKWWVAPMEYLAGNIPDGGSVWIRVRLSKQGQLLGYKVFHSNLTAEMELNVIQALISSLERPALPNDFPEEILVINWKFIYPPIMPQVKIRK